MTTDGRAAPILASAGVLFCVVLLAYQPVVAWVVPKWFGYRGFYGHGLLVVALAAHLLWRARGRFALRPHPRRARRALLALLAAVSAVGLAAWAGELLLLQIVALWATLLVGSWAILGVRSLPGLAPPFTLLLLALPIWAPFQPVLQATAAAVVDQLLQWLGIIAYVEDNFITVPNGTFEIEGGCSGLGFLLASVSLIGYLIMDARPGWLAAGKVLAGGLAVSLLANWLRILLIVLAGHFYGMGHWLVGNHVLFGWVLYCLLFLPYVLYLGVRIPVAPAEPAAARVESRAGLPVVFVVSVLVLAALPPGYARWLDGRGASAPPHAAFSMPASPRYRPTGAPVLAWVPHFEGASETLLGGYRSGTDEVPVWLYSAYYRQQTQGSEVVNRMNDLAGAGWSEEGVGADDGHRDLALTRVVLRSVHDERLLVWYWYEVGRLHAAGATAAKLAQVVERLGGRQDARIVAVATPCPESGCTTAAVRLRDFITDTGVLR